MPPCVEISEDVGSRMCVLGVTPLWVGRGGGGEVNRLTFFGGAL